MAALCGEWFYYDGQKLVLGNPKREDTTRAAFDVELQSLNISAGLEQLNTELYDYDPNTDDYKEDAAPESIDGVNSYMRVAKDRSSNFYKEPAKLPAGRAMIDESDIMATTRAHFRDRKSTRLNSSHVRISYAVVCLKKKKYNQ